MYTIRRYQYIQSLTAHSSKCILQIQATYFKYISCTTYVDQASHLALIFCSYWLKENNNNSSHFLVETIIDNRAT